MESSGLHKSGHTFSHSRFTFDLMRVRPSETQKLLAPMKRVSTQGYP